MNKNGFSKRLWKTLSVLLVAALLISSSNYGSLISIAEGIEDLAVEAEPEAAEEPVLEAEPEAQSEELEEPTPELEEPVYSISARPSNISFGNVTEGDYPDAQTIIIYNEGTTEIELAFSLSGCNLFTLDCPARIYIPANQSATFNVYFNENGAGSYAGQYLFWIQDHPSVNCSVYVTANVTEEIVQEITGVTVNPTSASVEKGGAVQFSSNVSGTNVSDSSVTWSVSGNASASTAISSNGYLTVGSDESSSAITVTAKSNADSSKSASVAVAIKSHTVTISTGVNPKDAGAVTGGGSYTEGSTVSLNASPNNGYSFVGWYEGDKQVCTTKRFDSKARDNTYYEARFSLDKCYISVDSSPQSGAGTITKSAYVNYGDSYTLEATPSSGYKFVGWKYNNQIVSYDQKYTISGIKENRSYTACFERSTCTVILTATPSTGGTVTGAGTYSIGSNVAISATPASGYTFGGWLVDNKVFSYDKSITLTNVTQDTSLVALFNENKVKYYTISASVDGSNGIISPEGKVSVPSGQTVTYLITPNNGYKVSSVYVDGTYVGTNTKYTFTKVTGDHTIIAKFEKQAQTTTTTKTATTNSSTKKSTTTDSKTSTTKTDTSKTSTTKTDTTKTDTTQEDTAKTDEATTEEDHSHDDEQLTTEITDLDAQDVVEVSDDEANEDYDELKGVLLEYNVCREEARELIRANEGNEMFETAYNEGYLSITVNNDYKPQKQTTADLSFFDDPSLTNYSQIMGGVLTEDDLLDALEGNQVSLNVDITQYTDDIPDLYKSAMSIMADKYNLNTYDYLDITMIKTVNDVSETISDFNGNEAEFVIELPDSLKGKEVSVIHIHRNANGKIEQTMLLDLDDDPDTVTFKTPNLSIFAFATPANRALNVITLLIALFTMIGLIVLLIWYAVIGRKKKAKRI